MSENINLFQDQVPLFDNIDDYDIQWREWQDMPEFIQEKQDPFAKVVFRFDSAEDLQNFSKLIGQNLTPHTKSAWYPYRSHWGGNNKIYTNES